jgi:hypothetical protein
MSRSYISIGPGGPRFGVVLGRRDMIDAVVSIAGIFAVVFALGAFGQAGNLPAGAQWLIVAIGLGAMFKLARRPYVPPMTAAEQEAAYQAAKAEFLSRPR